MTKTMTDVVELAKEVAAEEGSTDSVGLLARRLARVVVDQHAELVDRRAADLTREEMAALRGCSVHCLDEAQLKLATSAIDKTVALAEIALRCPRCGDSGVLKYITSGWEPYAARFCDCPAGEARR